MCYARVNHLIDWTFPRRFPRVATPAQQINGPSPDNATPRVPFFVPFFNPIARRLLGVGVPMGPNALLTVRGRTSGLPRGTPVAVLALGAPRSSVAAAAAATSWRNPPAAAGSRSTAPRRPRPG